MSKLTRQEERVLKIVNKLGTKWISLTDIYRKAQLVIQGGIPKPSIRRAMQQLRDKGVLKFTWNDGNYTLVGAYNSVSGKPL